MIFNKVPAAVMAGALLSCTGWSVASAQVANGQPYTGRVYSLHTKSVGGCPALDWHIVVGENQTLSGMIGTDDMKTVFRTTGTFDPVAKTFHLQGKQIGGSRTGAVNGQIQGDGVMAASLGGLPVGSACQGKTVYVRWNSPVDAYTSGGNG
jgi:hypothetical protein